MVKKAYMKTIEILLVIVISTIFIFAIMPSESNEDFINQEYLSNLEKDDFFRDFASANTGCYNTLNANTATRSIERYLPPEYGYIICVGEKTEPPDKDRMFVDSLVIVGNHTKLNRKIVWLYYWPNQI
jgi:hypothetical protein